MRKTHGGLSLIIALSMFAQPVFAITVADVPAALMQQNKVRKSELSSTPVSPPKQAMKSSAQKGLTLSPLTEQTYNKRLPAYVEGEIIVKFKEGRVDLEKASGVSKSTQFASRQNLSFKENIRRANLTVLKTKGKETTEQAIARLKADPDVEYVQPNYQYYATESGDAGGGSGGPGSGGGESNDPSFSEMWALENTGQTINGTPPNGSVFAGGNDADIDGKEAWTLSGGDGVIVAVIDSGVAYNHDDLIASMWGGGSCVGEDTNGNAINGGCNHGYDFEDNDKTPLPTTSSHGTHIAGTIAATKSNGVGIAGVAPQAKIMALKSSLTTAQIVSAINFAKQNGAKVINASWAGVNNDPALKTAIDNFPGLVITAAGNGDEFGDSAIGDDHGSEVQLYPCDFDSSNIVCVAATDQNDVLAEFSDFGATSVDIGAPGVNILSTVADTLVFEETFENASVPGLPNGWTEEGDFATVNLENQAVLYGDVPSFPYSSGLGVAFGPTMNLSGVNAGSLSFVTFCDTEYSATEWTDYMGLFVTGNGGASVVPIALWDEQTLDDNTNPNDVGPVRQKEYSIPQNVLTSNFRLDVIWNANDSDNNYGGCFIDNITVSKLSDGSDEEYEYAQGTSMATPHVAGVAAQVYALRPDFTAAQVKDAILANGDEKASLIGKTVSGKRLNAFAALDASNNGTLIVKKVVVNDDGGTAATSTFAFRVNDGDAQSFEEDGENELSLDAGTYTVTEVEAAGYMPTYLNCTDIVLAPGETKTCTITNDDDDVPDTTRPVITLVGETIMNLVVGAEFSEPGFEATDDVDGNISANVTIGGDEVNTAVPGTYVITYNVSDAIGNVAEEKVRTVNVSDVEAPTFSGVPENQNVEATSAAGAVVTYALPTATDDVDEGVAVTCAPESGTTFAMGPTVVECSATDSAGNDASASFNVVVADTTNPEISNVPEDQTIEITEGTSAVATYTLPTATDNIDGAVSVSCSPESGVTFALGATSVQCSATDSADNEAIASFTIAVVLIDETPPIITLSGETTVTLEFGDLFIEPGYSASDNIDGDLTEDVVVGGDTVDDTTPGTYAITYNVSDTAGNAAEQETRVVTISPAPPSDLTTLAATIDEAQTLHNGATEGDAPGQYPAGSKATLQTAIDEAGLITTTDSQSEVDVAVATLQTAMDTFSSSLTGPSDLTALVAAIAEAEALAAGATVGDEPGEYPQEALGALNAAITEAQSVDNSFAQSTISAAVITLNDAMADFEASVVPTPDTTAPIVTLSGSATTSVALGNAFVDPGATANDDVDGAVTPVVSGSVDTNAVGTYALTYTATDAAGNTSSVVRNVVVSATSLEVVTTSSGDAQTGTLTNAATLSTTTASGNVTIAMPANLTVSGPSGWDGTIDLPTSISTSVAPVGDSGSTASAVSTIEIGFGNSLLTFDKGVRLLFAGQGGNLIGYSHGAGTFTSITSTCSADTQTVGDSLAAGGDCKITVGSDLVVWTKHFSAFTTYTQTAIPAPTPTPSPAPSGGGGGGGGGGFIPSTSLVTSTSTSLQTNTPTTMTLAQAATPQGLLGDGQVLGASVYNFTRTIQRGSKGEDVIELQRVLIANGYLKIDAPTGFFGPITEAAVKAYQKANGLEQAGVVGPKTRVLLNKGTTSGTSKDGDRLILIEQLKAQLQILVAKLAALTASSTAQTQ
ncbi:hypothetical protein A3B35_03000 [Candidatus Kaiserbacteria bacterium RIFCSPLOWO2_01_FULL_54_24]|uniref:HYR domain-containing protein n=1 Tax=Candidatus Kaiserbacteria bacterium RIFCSPLOWO2_01_FULL_54_24 TaxID=1798515 RepID=A0A1F6ESY1_9BACT|nr:MAG: hypothetical protein A3B35_03000 [Candidatus Kaiserbacteria bacterium RIFCSPLOWO2_01_FULL_54_24]